MRRILRSRGTEHNRRRQRIPKIYSRIGKAGVLWLTGLSGSGKSTVARELETRLFDRGCHTMLLDGDNVRHGLNRDLGFTARDRTENIRRVGELARLFFEQGTLTLCTFVSPYRADRERVRTLLPEDRFLEIHVDCALDVCKDRDSKGLYARAEAGEIPHFTGVSSPYEPPTTPEVVIHTDTDPVDACVDRIIDTLDDRGFLRVSG